MNWLRRLFGIKPPWLVEQEVKREPVVAKANEALERFYNSVGAAEKIVNGTWPGNERRHKPR